MEIHGFKCFHKGLINRYNVQFKVNQNYQISGPIKFGVSGNGFHFCKNLEDSLRYFDAMNDEVSICKVIGSGKIVEFFDEYNGYYDMYSTSDLLIQKELSRTEIIQIGLDLNEIRVCRFISGYKLTKEEINLFEEKFKNSRNVQLYIDYYQKKDLNAFTKRR